MIRKRWVPTNSTNISAFARFSKARIEKHEIWLRKSNKPSKTAPAKSMKVIIMIQIPGPDQGQGQGQGQDLAHEIAGLAKPHKRSAESKKLNAKKKSRDR